MSTSHQQQDADIAQYLLTQVGGASADDIANNYVRHCGWSDDVKANGAAATNASLQRLLAAGTVVNEEGYVNWGAVD